MKQIHHWIGDEYHSGASGRSGIVFNPASGVQSGSLDLASVDDVDFAAATAKGALSGWRSASLARRSEIMFTLRALVDRHRTDIAKLLTRSTSRC